MSEASHCGGDQQSGQGYSKPTFKEIQAESMSQRTGIKSKAFYDIAEAEAWLDEG